MLTLRTEDSYLGGLKEYCKCPPVLQDRSKAEQRERKRTRERGKGQEVKIVWLVKSSTTNSSQDDREQDHVTDKQR